jgi:hypothetical protein
MKFVSATHLDRKSGVRRGGTCSFTFGQSERVVNKITLRVPFRHPQTADPFATVGMTKFKLVPRFRFGDWDWRINRRE